MKEYHGKFWHQDMPNAHMQAWRKHLDHLQDVELHGDELQKLFHEDEWYLFQYIASMDDELCELRKRLARLEKREKDV